MRRNLAALAVVGAALFASGTAAVVPSAATAATSKSCSAGYVHAALPWGEKCLRAGEFCKIGNRAYIKYGFTCPATGHLRRRG